MESFIEVSYRQWSRSLWDLASLNCYYWNSFNCNCTNDSKFIEPGMDITGRSDWKKIVEVSDDIKEKVIQQTRRNFINGFGMVNDESENFNEFIKKHAQTLPVDKRASTMWTLTQIKTGEAQKLVDIVREHNPTWKHGEPFDPSIFKNYFSYTGFDKRV